MSEEPKRVSQENSQLVPPSRRPPTAVAARTPESYPEPRRPFRARTLGRLIRERLAELLDATDAAVEAFAAELRRARSGGGE